jgi:hypothetical protein
MTTATGGSRSAMIVARQLAAAMVARCGVGRDGCCCACAASLECLPLCCQVPGVHEGHCSWVWGPRNSTAPI